VRTLFFLGVIFNSFGCFHIRAASTLDAFDLPVVSQDADVHTLSAAYCRPLWQSIVRGRDYIASTDPRFKDQFNTSVEELGQLILKIKAGQPVLVGGKINTMSEPIADPETLKDSAYFDSELHPTLVEGLKAMSVLGKHKGKDDRDTETNAKVNEIFVYVWSKVKKNPAQYLPAFLVGLADAAPTCIQGYSVRMLCAVHPPKLKIVAKKK
jgi:hypothetical protein